MSDGPGDAPPPLEYATPAPSNHRRRWWIVGSGIIALLFAVSLLLPTRNRPNIMHGNVGKCSSNLRMIGLAIRMYADSNHAAFPASLSELLATQDLPSDTFVCPASNDQRVIAPTTQQAAALLLIPNAHHCSYFYAGDGLTDTTVQSDHVIAFELPANHGSMVNVLFGDLHVDRLDANRAAADATRLANLQADLSAGVRPIKLRP